MDLASGFGVAAIGHAHPYWVLAVEEAARSLPAGLGDLAPSAAKARLLAALVARYPWGRAKAMLGLSGSDAVEIAWRTAYLATGRAGIVALEGAYHGLSWGALRATHDPRFWTPFERVGAPRAAFVPFVEETDPDPAAIAEARAAARALFRTNEYGCLLVEPIQGRAGIRVPAPGYLEAIAEEARAAGALVVSDEIYTGLGRTGRFFAIEEREIAPDLVCLGKALGGGLPISACIGRAEAMEAWPPPDSGEAIYTQTFLGWPIGCAAALATLEIVEADRLPERAARIGGVMEELLGGIEGVRLVGRGALRGLRFPFPADGVAADAVRAGVLVHTEGPDRRTLALVPPLAIAENDLRAALTVVARCAVRALAKARA